MFLSNNEHKFYFKSKGDVTGQPFEGDFVVKCVLNNMEQVEVGIRTDRYNAGSMTINPAHALINRTIAELEMRVIEAPTWWKESDYGRTLYDTNILYEVFAKTMEGQKIWHERLKKEADEAEKDADKSQKAKKAKEEKPAQK